MKISELIKALKEIKTIHGDLQVTVFSPEEMANGIMASEPAYLTLDEDDDGNPTAVTIIDRETYEAFI